MKIKTSWDDKLFSAISYTLLTLVFFVAAYPIYFIIIASVSDPVAVGSGQVIFAPVNLNFEGYKAIFEDTRIWRGFFNSICIVVLGTLFNLFLTLPAAYALSVKRFKIRSTLMKIFMFTMYFSGGLIPTYLLVNNIGLYNKPYTLIFLGGVSVTNIIIARTTIANSIPYEMYEAVTIDGGDHFLYFFRFVLPLSKAIIAVLMLYYGVGHWNSYYNAMIYLTNKDYYPLQLVLRNILVLGERLASRVEDSEDVLRAVQRAELMKYCLIVVSSVPMFVIYPFIQKYFQKGVMIGSVKG